MSVTKLMDEIVVQKTYKLIIANTGFELGRFKSIPKELNSANMTQIPPSDSIAPPTSTPPSTDVGEPEKCDHSDDGVPQWACSKCLDALNRNFDDVLRSVMLKEGWTEDEINTLSLRQFSKISMAEMVPNPSDTEEVQTRAWGANCVRELQARIDASRNMHEARSRSEN